MRYAVATVLICVLAAGIVAQAAPAPPKRPVVLIFDTVKGEGADNELVAACTKALRNYLRYTQRVEAAVLDRESPTVRRAIMEKRVTADQIASYSNQEERLLVAKVLSFEYATGAEVSIKESGLQVKLWLGKVDGAKKDKWEVTGSARAAGSGASDTTNALQSATSMAVMEVTRLAFADLPVVKQPDPVGDGTTTAIGANQPPTVKQPAAADYAKLAEESAKAGDLAMAIQQYSQAVSADPTDSALRIKLAQVYARKNLFKEAYDELGRASLAGADAAAVADARKSIEALEKGEPPVPAKPDGDPAKVDPKEPLPLPDKPPVTSVTAVGKMIEGDKLWNKGKPDEAADSYRESIKLNPTDWRAHERLAVVCASMSLFTESRKALEMLNKVDPEPEPGVVANRYEMFRKAFDSQFARLLRQYDSTVSGVAKGATTRESGYNEVKGLEGRLESMAKFLDAVTVPARKQPAHLRRSLAVGLAAQAASSLLEHLETNSDKAKSNAEVFIGQAKREIEAAVLADSNKVIVKKDESAEDATSDTGTGEETTAN